MKKSFVDKILTEAAETEHLLDRFQSRFTSTNSFAVGYEASPMNYVTVGTYTLPEPTQQLINQNVNLIKNYNFPRNKDLGIKIVDLNIDKNKVDYKDEDAKIKSKQFPLVIVDASGSNGNVVYGIVRKNVFTTLYFGKNYIPQTTQKLQVDFLVSNLKQAIEQQKIR